MTTSVRRELIAWRPADPVAHHGHPLPLGRHVRHDERSRAFAVQAAPADALRSVLHTRRVPVFDQGELGSCVANALAGVLSTQPFRHRYHEPTAVRFYRQITAHDDVPGQWPPDDVGSDALSAMKWARSVGLIGSYLHAFSLAGMLTALQTQTVMMGIRWLDGCDTPDSSGLVRYTGAERGGHEIQAVGVDVDRKLVRFANSWGAGWGDAGYFDMTYDDVTAALADDGDVGVPQAA